MTPLVSANLQTLDVLVTFRLKSDQSSDVAFICSFV